MMNENLLHLSGNMAPSAVIDEHDMEAMVSVLGALQHELLEQIAYAQRSLIYSNDYEAMTSAARVELILQMQQVADTIERTIGKRMARIEGC